MPARASILPVGNDDSPARGVEWKPATDNRSPLASGCIFLTEYFGRRPSLWRVRDGEFHHSGTVKNAVYGCPDIRHDRSVLPGILRTAYSRFPERHSSILLAESDTDPMRQLHDSPRSSLRAIPRTAIMRSEGLSGIPLVGPSQAGSTETVSRWRAAALNSVDGQRFVRELEIVNSLSDGRP